MSQAKKTHVQVLRAQTEAVQQDLNAEFITLSKVTREGLLMSARRIVILERRMMMMATFALILSACLVLLSLRV